MAFCLIDDGITLNCAVDLVPKVLKPVVYLTNFSDLKEGTITPDGTSLNITSIALAGGGKQWYKFELHKSSGILLPTGIFRAVDEGQPGFDHTIPFKVILHDQDEVNNMAEIRNARVACILQYEGTGGLLFGENVGLNITDFQALFNEGTNGNLIGITLATPAGSAPENKPYAILDSTFDFSGLETPTA
jgi:hypothetical protein